MSITPILMIQTRDKRKYFTDVKNLPMLTEFAKTFGAELSLVESADIDPLGFDKLAPALCDESYRTPKQSRKARLLRKIYPRTEDFHHNRRSMIDNAQQIRNHIGDTLKGGEVLVVKDLKCKFGNLHLSNSCISNHIAAVRREMKKSGFDVYRIKSGLYQLVK